MVSIMLAALARQSAPLPKPPPMLVELVERGWGDAVVPFARTTVHFVAANESGSVIADTEKRGMPYTFLFGQDTTERFWHAAVEGGHVGDVRAVRLPAFAVGLDLDGDPEVTVTIRIIKVAPL